MFPDTPTRSDHVNAIFPILAVLTRWVKRRSLGQTGLKDAITPGQQLHLRLRPIPTNLLHEELGLATGYWLLATR